MLQTKKRGGVKDKSQNTAIAISTRVCLVGCLRIPQTGRLIFNGNKITSVLSIVFMADLPVEAYNTQLSRMSPSVPQ